MATSDNFLGDVRARCFAVPVPVAEKAIRDAAREFCESTNIYRVALQANSVKGQAYFTLTIPSSADQELAQVRRVWYKTNPRPLDHAPNIGINTPFAYFASVSGEAPPEAAPTVWYELDEFSFDRVGVWYAPDETLANAFSVLVSLKPVRDSLVIPDILLRDWYWAIVWGAVKRIREIPNEPYSGDARAAEVEWSRRVLDAKVAADRAMSPGAMSVQMQPFAWGNKQWR